MTVAVNTEGKGQLSIAVTGVASTDNAGIGQIANPEGATLLILRTTFYGITNSTGAANLGIGVVASGAKGTDILNDLSMAAVAGKAYNGHVMQNGAKTEIQAPAYWTPSTYITFTGSASTVGLTGTLYVEYVRV